MYRRITETHREAISAALGASPDLCSLAPRIEAEATLDGYQRLKVSYQVHLGEFVSAYLLLPNDFPQPMAGLVCLHPQPTDWTIGAAQMVGLAGDPSQAVGLELVKRGYVVLAPDQLGFGERGPGGLEEQTRQLAQRLLKGETLLKKSVWDISRGLDYLESLPQVNPERLGLLGQGSGSLLALWTAALDERVTAAAGHGEWTSLNERLRRSLPIPLELVAPRLLHVADLDRILAQVAPRPFLISALENDPHSLDPGLIYAKASEIYRAFDVENPLTLYHHPADADGSAFPASAREAAYEWLGGWLQAT
jgi:dienelactone hydrolase